MLATDKVRSMPLWQSMLILLIVALLGIACFYGLRPSLEQAGWNAYSAYLVSVSVVFVVLLIWSLLAFISEGNPRTFEAYLRRNRLDRLSARTCAWSVALGLVMFLSTAVFSPLMAHAVASGFLPLPQGIPDYLNPSMQQSLAQLRGQLVSQGVLPLIPVVLTLNILAEELFWRGIVLPRQELRHGKSTFLVHGSIWALAHVFQYWMLPPILIGAIALAYAVQRTRNTWVSILAHLLNNSLPFIVMLFL